MINPKFRFGYAWVLLTLAFTIHVIDEAVFDFLPFYNSVVTHAKEKFSFFPFPDFTYRTWLSGLIIVLIILYLLSVAAFQRKRWIIYFSVLYGVIMFLNGVLHIIGSIYFSTPIGGVFSSPILLVVSTFLLWCAIKDMRAAKT
jgi:hypothetical protein